MSNAIYSNEYKFIYFKIPKCATRSIICFLDGATKIKKLDKKTETEKFRDFLKFTFVRNPYDRLVSCYFDKIKTKHLTEYNKKIRNKLNNKNYNFKEFILKISNGNNIQLDKHWNLYSNLVDFNYINFVGKFENLRQDTNTICEKLGIPRQNLPHINKSKHKHYTEYYDDETRQIVAEKYRKDIEYFGYKFGE